MSNEQEKRDNENYAKNFTRTCNIVLESYKHLTHEEKFLYIKLKCVYWDAKPRFATLREISHLTGYVISALSRILPRLHKCGLVHAEIKQEHNPDGSKKGKPKYYITIPDIWELNRKYFECSPEERFDPSDVLLENNNVLQKNNNVLLENENVLLKNDVVPPEEHFRGAQTSSRARLQAAKDKKDIIKDSKKESMPTVTQTETNTFTHSSSHSFSSVDTPVEKQASDVHVAMEPTNTSETREPVTTRNTSTMPNIRNTEPLMEPEQKRVAGYLKKLKFPFANSKENVDYLATIAEYIESFEQMKSYYDFTRGRYQGGIYLGNLANLTNMGLWTQTQDPLPEKQQEQPKKKGPMTNDEWVASLTASVWS